MALTGSTEINVEKICYLAEDDGWRGNKYKNIRQRWNLEKNPETKHYDKIKKPKTL